MFAGLRFLCVTVAVAGITFLLTVQRGRDLRASESLAAKEAEIKKKLARLDEKYRHDAPLTGFNLLIVPEGRSSGDHDSATFPEEYAARIAKSRMMSMGRVQPTLQSNQHWPEEKRTIRLFGVRGEVPLRGADPKRPLEPVPVGSIALGYNLVAKRKVGDRITLLGREFTVARVTADDATAWIHLKDAQELLGKNGQINAILVMNAHCPSDQLGRIRAEVAELLPGTQVVEFGTQVLTRAEDRQRAEASLSASLNEERNRLTQERGEQGAFVAIAVPVVMVVSMLGFGFLTYRGLRNPVAKATADGAGWNQVGTLLRSTLVIGLGGALVGSAIGWLIASVFLTARFDPALLLRAVLLTPGCAVLAAWLPTLATVRKWFSASRR